jgi:hypothetical protein
MSERICSFPSYRDIEDRRLRWSGRDGNRGWVILSRPLELYLDAVEQVKLDASEIEPVPLYFGHAG